MDWCAKHRPRCLKDLCVSPQKVKKVREWLEAFLAAGDGAPAARDPRRSKVLVLTGQTGTGKSTTVELLCEDLGLELLTWNAPTPTLWHEHEYQKDLAPEYTSKLREFEEFLRRSTVLSQIPLAAGSSSRGPGKRRPGSPSVILIDDLPATHGFDQHTKVFNLLKTYGRLSRHPLILCLSNIHKLDIRDNQTYFQDRIVRMLEESGAEVVSFPSVTALRVAKVLQRACEAEGLCPGEATLARIADACNGDARNALTSLQFAMAGSPRANPPPHPGKKAKKRKRVPPSQIRAKGSLPDSSSPPPGAIARDREVDQFHVLGKILHNKRVPETGALENDCQDLIAKSHLDTQRLLSHVHENFVSFLGPEAIEEAARILEYLSDAVVLSDPEDPSAHTRMGVSAASMVGVLGYQHCNVSKPQRVGFHAFRTPAGLEVAKARVLNQFELDHVATERAKVACTRETRAATICETLPYTRTMMMRTGGGGGGWEGVMPRGWHSVESARGTSRFATVSRPAPVSAQVRAHRDRGNEDEEEDEIEDEIEEVL